MSVLNRQTSGQAVPSYGSRVDGNRNKGDDIYPGSGPLDGGQTLHPALVYIDDDVPSIELIYLEIICCV